MGFPTGEAVIACPTAMTDEGSRRAKTKSVDEIIFVALRDPSFVT